MSSENADNKTSSKSNKSVNSQMNSVPRKLLHNFRQYTSSLIVASRGVCKPVPSSTGSGSNRVEEALMITMNRSRDISQILSEMSENLEGYEGGSAKKSLEQYSSTQPTVLKKRKRETAVRKDLNKLPSIEVIDIE